MGVSLSQLVKGREIGFEDLYDKRIAIDAFNWIYQFLSIIRQPDGTPLQDSSGRITSHLSGLYYRTLKLLESNIKPVYVFDGTPPEIKRRVTEARHSVRAEAAREWKEALEQKDYEKARKAAQRSAVVTDEIIESSKKLLSAMGVPCIQAPSEGEALCSILAKKGDVFAVSSQDYDVLLFGSPRLVKNLSISGKKKRAAAVVQVNPEMITLSDALDALGITQDQLIILGILIGTDYNPGGVAGYGPKKALEIVKRKKTLDAIFSDLIWDFPVTPAEIFDFFKNPADGNYDLSPREPDETEIMAFMCDEHEFSEERISSALKKLKESKKDQSSLSRWI